MHLAKAVNAELLQTLNAGWLQRGPEDPPCVTYRFKVEKESGPYAIKAEWLQDGGQRHATKLSRLIRLGTPLPDILLKLYR
jgi:hypothetical protein